MHAVATPVLARPDAPRETSVPCELLRTTKSVPGGENHCSVTPGTRTDTDLTESAHMSRHDPERNRYPHTRNPSPHSAHWPGYTREMWRDPNTTPTTPHEVSGTSRAPPGVENHACERGRSERNPHEHTRGPKLLRARTTHTIDRETHPKIATTTRRYPRSPTRPHDPSFGSPAGLATLPRTSEPNLASAPPLSAELEFSLTPSRSVAGRDVVRAHTCEATRGMRAK